MIASMHIGLDNLWCGCSRIVFVPHRLDAHSTFRGSRAYAKT